MFSTVHIYALCIGSYTIYSLKHNTLISIFKDLVYPHLTYHTEHSFLTSNKVVTLIKKRTRFSTKYLYAACYTHWMPIHFGAAPYLWGHQYQSPPHNPSRLLEV